jgi:hypothetical protein
MRFGKGILLSGNPGLEESSFRAPACPFRLRKILKILKILTKTKTRSRDSLVAQAGTS